MNTITFKCEIITPMFLAGADGTKPELRPASIKGALRFWWRALNGNLLIDDKKDAAGKIVKGLRTLETEIFGGGGDYARRSTFVLKTSHETVKPFTEYPLLHHSGGTNCLSCGVGRKCVKNYPSFAIKNDTSFFAQIQGSDLEKIELLFIIACFFGGLGKRSRRGFGSIEIVRIKKNHNDFMEFKMPSSLDSVLNYIKTFNDDYKIDTNKIIIDPTKESQYKNQYPYVEEICIGSESYPSYEKLVERIGKSSHKHQTKTNGFPKPRFSSPSYVSAMKIDGRYYPIITSLHLAFPKTITDSKEDKDKRFGFVEAILDKNISL